MRIFRRGKWFIRGANKEEEKPGHAPAGLRGSFVLNEKNVLRDQVTFCGKYVAIGLALILLGAIAQLIEREPYDRLMREGQQVTGIVTRCTTEAKKTYSAHFASHYTIIHELAYQFEVPVDGILTTFKGWEEVEPEDCLFSREPEQLLDLLEAGKPDDLSRVDLVGQPIQVIYAASDASVFALKDKPKAPFPGFTLAGCILGGPPLLFGIVALVDTFKVRAKKQARF